jgi:hypothetical protein
LDHSVEVFSGEIYLEVVEVAGFEKLHLFVLFLTLAHVTRVLGSKSSLSFFVVVAFVPIRTIGGFVSANTVSW